LPVIVLVVLTVAVVWVVASNARRRTRIGGTSYEENNERKSLDAPPA